MIDNGCSFEVHPVASAPLKAQLCICLSPPEAEKFNPPAPRVVVDFAAIYTEYLFYFKPFILVTHKTL
jgi:hypothetical protein